MKKIIIIGAGGHAKVIADIILKRKEKLNENIELIGFLDDRYDKKTGLNIFGRPVIGKVEKIKELIDEDTYFIIAIGNNKVRKNIYKNYSNLKYYTVIHPVAILGKHVEVGEGTVIKAGAIISPLTKIGKHCLINSNVVIEQESVIEDFVDLYPNCTIYGEVFIGEGSVLHPNVSTVHGVKIGRNSEILPGEHITDDVLEEGEEQNASNFHGEE